MASPAAAGAEAVLLLAAAFLLPLRLLFVALRHRQSPPCLARSSAALLAAAVLLTAIYAVPDVPGPGDANADSLRSEIEALRVKVARLESMLGENTNMLNSKAKILEKDNKLIEAMESHIQLLMNGLENTENSQSKSYSAGNIKSMEDEVQQLQQEISKINSNSCTIESLARDTEKRVEALSSDIKKIEDIIAEQWIQIRQFEQAFVLTKMMTSKVHERSRPSETVYKWLRKETILKYARNIDFNDILLRGASFVRACFSHTYDECRNFVQAINKCYHEASRFHRAIHRQYMVDNDRPNVFFLSGSISRSCTSLPYNKFRVCMSSAQRFHHKVQLSILGAMKSNRHTRVFANELVTFFLAYLVVVSPMWIAWFLYSMRFSS